MNGTQPETAKHDFQIGNTVIVGDEKGKVIEVKKELVKVEFKGPHARFVNKDKVKLTDDEAEQPMDAELIILRQRVAELEAELKDYSQNIMANGRLERELQKERDAHKLTKDEFNQLRMDSQKEVNAQVQSMMDIKNREVADLRGELAELKRPKTHHEIKTLDTWATPSGRFASGDAKLADALNDGWQILHINMDTVLRHDLDGNEEIWKYRQVVLQRMVAIETDLAGEDADDAEQPIWREFYDKEASELSEPFSHANFYR